MTFWSACSARAWRSAAVLAVLAPSALAAQSRNGLLVGRVLSGDVAVPSAAITASGGRVTLARVDGRYRMTLPAGRYSVRAQRIGFTTATDTVTITAGVTSTLNFKVERAVAALESVASIGSFGPERAAIDLLVPVDVIDGAQLRSTGRTTTSAAIQAFAPSIGLSASGEGQASDLIHPVSMRGLGPDHVLVLVDGKRRHGSALVNTNRSLGRGASGTDLDAIPLSMIERVEILHGDAVAQYGSDAVAGVINVVLKSGVHGFAASTAGERMSTFNRDADAGAGASPATVSARDGRTFEASIDKGVVFGERGFLHGGFELRDRGATNRAVADTRFTVPPASSYGDPHSHDVSLVLNGGNLFASGLEAYGNVGGSRRRLGMMGQQFASAFSPPGIDAKVNDYNGTAGVRGQTDDWRWDLSSTYGRNAVGLAYRLGSSDMDIAEQRATQWTTNLDLNRELSYFEETRIAIGGELRRDGFDVDPKTGASLPLVGQPVFLPEHAVSRGRSSLGGHLEVDADLTSDLTIGLAGRVERFDELGTQTAGKMSARFEPKEKLVFRGSVARGYRVPSLQQSSLGVLYFDPATSAYVELLPASDPSVVFLSGGSLKPERSTTYQVGVATELSPSVSFTVDAYRTDLSERLLPSEGSILQSFTNGTRTRTDGLDATLSYGLRFENGARLRLTGGANVNHTTLVGATGLISPAVTLEQTRITRGEPRSNLLAAAVFALNDLGATLRVQRVGEVTGYGNSANAPQQTFGAAWLTDAKLSYTLVRKYTFSVGADNLFDVYPDRGALGTDLIGGVSYRGVSPYTTNSPFGFNGRFVYGRLSIYL